jgi:hypothetical protein
LYVEFREKVKQSLLDPTLISIDDNVNTALLVIRTEMQARMEATIVEEENLEIEYGIGEAATYPQPSMWSVDDAMRILAQNAVIEFGYAPRDMCLGVFDLQEAKEVHDDALSNLEFEKLNGFIRAFSSDHSLEGISHRILEVYPRPRNPGLLSDRWTVGFKTDHIAKKAFVTMREIEDQHLRSAYKAYCNTQIASSFAGSLFEVIIHNMLARGRESDGVQPPQPICMSTKDGSQANSPVFTTDPPSTIFSTPESLLSSLFKSRRITEIDFGSSASVNNHVTLEENILYLPRSPNNPLFDSCTIDIIQDTAIISVFQITISEVHGGSPKGYPNIRRIMTRVRRLIKTKADVTKVKVAYFLIGCSDRPHFQWDMPDGWTEGVITNNHCGDVFCVKVPI